jgi:hypothetical protein
MALSSTTTIFLQCSVDSYRQSKPAPKNCPTSQTHEPNKRGTLMPPSLGQTFYRHGSKKVVFLSSLMSKTATATRFCRTEYKQDL